MKYAVVGYDERDMTKDLATFDTEKEATELRDKLAAHELRRPTNDHPFYEAKDFHMFNVDPIITH